MIFFSHVFRLRQGKLRFPLCCICGQIPQEKMRRGSAEMRAEMNRIFWAADSTVQTNDYTTYPQTGIGQVFSLFIKPEYQVNNHAKNCRSTKSLMDEGRQLVQEISCLSSLDTMTRKKRIPPDIQSLFPLTWRILKPLSVWQKIIAPIRC